MRHAESGGLASVGVALPNACGALVAMDLQGVLAIYRLSFSPLGSRSRLGLGTSVLKGVSEGWQERLEQASNLEAESR